MERWTLERSNDCGRHARLDLESHMTRINVPVYGSSNVHRET